MNRTAPPILLCLLFIQNPRLRKHSSKHGQICLHACTQTHTCTHRELSRSMHHSSCPGKTLSTQTFDQSESDFPKILTKEPSVVPPWWCAFVEWYSRQTHHPDNKVVLQCSCKTFVCISTALLTWDTSAPTAETTLSLSGYWRHEIWVWHIIKDKKDEKEGGRELFSDMHLQNS